MPNYSNLSTWDTTSGRPNWYDYAIGRAHLIDESMNMDPAAPDDDLEGGTTQAEIGDFDQNGAWFYQQKEYDSSFGAGGYIESCLPPSSTSTKAETTFDLPVAKSKHDDTYFGYMFADASHNDNTVQDLLDFQEDLDAPRSEGSFIGFESQSPPFFEPQTPEPECLPLASDVLGQQDPDLQEQVALDTNVFLSKHSDLLELSEANATSVLAPDCSANFCRFKPASDRESAHNIQLHDPDHIYNLASNHHQEPFILPTSYLDPPETEVQLKGSRTILQPKSTRRTLARKILQGLRVSATSEDKKHHRTKKSVGKPEIDVSRKRQVQNVDNEYCSQAVDAHGSRNKKARFSFHGTSEQNEIESPFSSDQSSSADQSSLRTISRDFFKRKPLRSPPKGYAGQFDGMRVDKNTQKAIFASDIKESKNSQMPYAKTFGDMSHPNGIFTNTNFRADDLAGCPDYDEYSLPPRHPLQRCMSFATNMMISSCQPDIVALRSPEEETLRREGHIECASARLEGVAVGFWRYMEGSYGLEEYRQAGMCICWDECECNKMCTRFGDLKCPCGGDIIVHGDD